MEFQKTYEGGRFTGQYHVHHHTCTLLRILPGIDGHWILHATPPPNHGLFRDCLYDAVQAFCEATGRLAPANGVLSGEALLVASEVPRGEVRALVTDIINRFDNVLHQRLQDEVGEFTPPQPGVPF